MIPLNIINSDEIFNILQIHGERKTLKLCPIPNSEWNVISNTVIYPIIFRIGIKYKTVKKIFVELGGN